MEFVTRNRLGSAGKEGGPRKGEGVVVTYVEPFSGCTDDACRDSDDFAVERNRPTGS
jgi:hypothetical protein